MTSPAPGEPSTYFRKGFGLKADVQDALAADYEGSIVDLLKANAYTLAVADVTIRLAREFGFCYGVERAVEYAYQTRAKFPDRRIYLVGEIIHNPLVNGRLRQLGIDILAHPDPTGAFDFSAITPEDVVIMPAFGVTIDDFSALRALGCILVDTTCGSVLNVWKRVETYARDGFTALIHGKYYHEETRATASQVRKYPNGHYLIVRNMEEAQLVCDFIEGRRSADELMTTFARAVWPGAFGLNSQQELGAEKQVGTELGLDLMLRRALSLRVTRFDQRASGLIQLVGVPGDTASRTHRVRYDLENLGEISNRGWELESSMNVSRLTLSATLSLVKSRVEKVAEGYKGDLIAGDRMLLVPARTGGVSASWLGRNWSASLGASRALDWINYDELGMSTDYLSGEHSAYDFTGQRLRQYWRRYNGALRVRASLSRDIRDMFTFEVSGDNLLDYQRNEPDNLTVLPGRTITTGMKVRF